MSENNTFYAQFNEQTMLFRGIVAAWIDDGVLNVRYADDTEEVLGPISSYADAVEHGYAGPGTSYPDEQSWSQHIAEVTTYAADSEAWAVGTIGEVAIVDENEHPAYHNNSKYYAQQAAASAQALAGAEQRITGEGGAEDRIEAYEQDASDSADEAKAWAIGDSQSQSQPSSSNNAKAYAEACHTDYESFRTTYTGQFTTDVNAVNTFATSLPGTVNAVKGYKEDSECWAKGTKNGTDVPASSDPTAPTIQNNSKYYSNQSANKALVSEGFALGKQNGVDVQSGTYFHNNAKYFSDLAADNATMQTVVTYQTSNQLDFNSLDPNAWSTTITPEAGKYLWSRAQITIGTINPVVSTVYNVGYIGSSGTGAVDSVNGASGDVVLSAYDIKTSTAQDAPTVAAAITPITSTQIHALFESNP